MFLKIFLLISLFAVIWSYPAESEDQNTNGMQNMIPQDMLEKFQGYKNSQGTVQPSAPPSSTNSAQPNKDQSGNEDDNKKGKSGKRNKSKSRGKSRSESGDDKSQSRFGGRGKSRSESDGGQSQSGSGSRKSRSRSGSKSRGRQGGAA